MDYCDLTLFVETHKGEWRLRLAPMDILVEYFFFGWGERIKDNDIHASIPTEKYTDILYKTFPDTNLGIQRTWFHILTL